MFDKSTAVSATLRKCFCFNYLQICSINNLVALMFTLLISTDFLLISAIFAAFLVIHYPVSIVATSLSDPHFTSKFHPLLPETYFTFME